MRLHRLQNVPEVCGGLDLDAATLRDGAPDRSLNFRGGADMTYAIILVLAFLQNIAFSMTGRSRNRDNMTYHALCAVASNGLWFATMGVLVVAEMSWWLAPFYIVGTVAGSVLGAKISMRIERLIGARV